MTLEAQLQERLGPLLEEFAGAHLPVVGMDPREGAWRLARVCELLALNANAHGPGLVEARQLLVLEGRKLEVAERFSPSALGDYFLPLGGVLLLGMQSATPGGDACREYIAFYVDRQGSRA